MNNLKVLKVLYGLSDQVLAPYAKHDVDDLILELEQEEQSKDYSKDKKSKYRAAVNFAKSCVKCMKDTRPALAGAFPIADGRQAICDGVRMVVYDEPMNGLPEIDSSLHDKVIDINAIMPIQTGEFVSVELPSVDTLQNTYKIAKAKYTGKPGHFTLSTKILDCNGGAHWFNTKYLIELIQCTEPTVSYFTQPSYLGMLYVEGEGVKGILLPVNKSKERVEADEETEQTA